MYVLVFSAGKLQFLVEHFDHNFLGVSMNLKAVYAVHNKFIFI